MFCASSAPLAIGPGVQLIRGYDMDCGRMRGGLETDRVRGENVGVGGKWRLANGSRRREFFSLRSPIVYDK